MKRQKYKLLACFLWLLTGLLPTTAYADKFIGYYLSADVALRQLELTVAAEFYDKLIRRDLTELNRQDRLRVITKASQAYLLSGQYQKAAKLRQYHSTYAIPRLLQALQAIRQERWQAATQQLDKISDTEDNRVWRYWVMPFLRVWVLAGQEKAPQAFEALHDLQSIEALADIVPLQEMRLYLHLKQPQAVLEKLSDKGDLPALFLAHYLQALALVEGRKAALKLLREKSPEIEATTHHSAGAALEEVRHALENDIAIEATLIPPTQAIADLFLYVAELLSRELPQEALIYARLSDYAMTDNHAATHLIADILATMEQYDEAIAILRVFAKRQENSAEESLFAIELRISDYLLQSGKEESAEERLLDLRDRYPDNAEAREALASLYRQTDAYKQAIALYNEEIALLNKLETKNWRVFYLRGIAYERLKDWTRAEKDFLQAHALAPDNPYVMNYLGYSWVDRGENLQRGFRLLQKAENLRSNDGAIADSLGWAYYRLGNYDSAIVYLEKAVSLSPESSVIVDHLGDAYWQIGRRNEARFQWRRALRMKDMTEELQKVIRQKLKQAESGDFKLSHLGLNR